MTLTSVWRQHHPHHAAIAGQAEVTGTWDVIVVGAGITGLSTAALLGQSGLSVLVLEGRHVGDGTTGGSTAKVSLLQGTQLSRIASRHSPSVVARYVEANLAAQAWVAGVCDEHGVATQRRPAFTYATTDAGERSARQELDHARTAGLPAGWVDAVDLPYATRGAVTLPDQLQTDPLELLHALRSVVESHGGQVAEHARVLGVSGRRPITVTTERGEAQARTVVVATNSPMLDRGGHFARLRPARSYSVAFRTGGTTPAVDGMYLSVDPPSRSLRDAADADGSPLLLVGGEGHTTGREPSPHARLDRLRTWTREHFGPLEEIAAWSAQDYLPHHALPWAGPLVPGRNDLLFAGGFSKWGMTNGVAAAHVLAARISGEDLPPWEGVFSPWSTRQVNGLSTAGLYSAEVALALTAGWLGPLRRSATPAPAEGQGHVGRAGRATPTAVSTTDGVTRRVSGVCTHLGGVVAWNDAERSWDCPLHGSRFDADGEVLEGFATCGLSRPS